MAPSCYRKNAAYQAGMSPYESNSTAIIRN